MTTSSIKPTVRQTSAYVRELGLRALIVTVQHGIMELRPKGLRKFETVDLAGVWAGAVKARVMREKAEKAKARKARGTK